MLQSSQCQKFLRSSTKMSRIVEQASKSYLANAVDVEPAAKKFCEVSNDQSTSSTEAHVSEDLKLFCNNKYVKRKKAFSLLNVHSSIKRESEQYLPDETDYYFENGFRKVYPYFFTYHTFCKGRWLGKTLHELYSNEFRFYSLRHYEAARKDKNLLINLKPIDSLDVVLKPNDMISSTLHRHECPVTDAPITIIHDDSKYLVVNKPSSIPIHPCGRYRHNTLCYILRKEMGYENLLGCHRIDRLTSGIVIFAKTKHYANKIISEITNREVEKEYVCKVFGEFPNSDSPEGVVCNQPVTVYDRKLGISVAWKIEGLDSKEASTHFRRLSTDGDTSVVLCRPKTGRTHQIRIHLQYLGHPIINDPLYNNEVWGKERFQHGPCTRNLDDVASELSRIHTDIPVPPVPNPDPTPSATKTNSENTVEDTSSKPTPADDNPHFSSKCLECLNPVLDPKPEWMTMYLHAHRYKGSDWEFKTGMPEWAHNTT